MITFEGAQALIAKGRGNGTKKLGRNTWLEKDGETFVVRLHQTNIIRIFSSGLYELNSGGWNTMVTKDRINEYSPASITQRNFVWYLKGGVEFFDGVIVDSSGKSQTIPESVKRRMKA